jgi:hypothetical protein
MTPTMKAGFPLLAVAIVLTIPAAAQDPTAANRQKPDIAQSEISKAEGATRAAARPKVTVRRYTWRGYGFLPGYPRTERERQRDKALTERRYIDRFGRVSYGFGGPGFYGGQYNGGSFGPCWTSTPIGMMWNCGR